VERLSVLTMDQDKKENLNSSFEEFHRVENGLPSKAEILKQGEIDGYIKPEQIDKTKKIGYSKDIQESMYKDYDVKFDETTGKFLDGMGADYSIQEAVAQNAENLKRRRALDLKPYNANNANPELLEYQRKHHSKIFGRKNDKKYFDDIIDNFKRAEKNKSFSPPAAPKKTPDQMVQDSSAIATSTRGIEGVASDEVFKRIQIENYIRFKADEAKQKQDQEIINKFGDGGIVRLLLNEEI